jgi:hypothetical protein
MIISLNGGAVFVMIFFVGDEKTNGVVCLVENCAVGKFSRFDNVWRITLKQPVFQCSYKILDLLRNYSSLFRNSKRPNF